MIRGVIFDMDGVVIDSGEAIYNSWNSIFEDSFGITLPREKVALQLGKSPKDFTQYFIDKYKLKIANQELNDKVTKKHDETIFLMELKPGIKELLIKLKGKYKTALATGASKKHALYYLRKFEIENYFDYIVAGDEVKEAKPSQEIFLKAAENLNHKPEECIVIEDAILGITAAKRAGIKVISIPDKFTELQDHSIADMHLKSLLEVNENVIKQLGEKHG